MDLEAFEEGEAHSEIIEILVEREELQGAALGIAKKVLEEGTESLSPKQLAVYEQQIVPHFSMTCSRCDVEMPTSEIAGAMTEDDELCSWCRKMEENDNDDDYDIEEDDVNTEVEED